MGLQESMLLWIPGTSESLEESDDLNSKVTAANGAVIDFCDRQISLDELLQIVEFYGGNVDNYRADLLESIVALGG